MTHISTETSSWPDPKNGGNITWRSSVNVCPHYWAMKAQMPHQDKVNIYRSTSSFPSSPKLTGISHTLQRLSVIRLVFWKLLKISLRTSFRSHNTVKGVTLRDPHFKISLAFDFRSALSVTIFCSGMCLSTSYCQRAFAFLRVPTWRMTQSVKRNFSRQKRWVIDLRSNLHNVNCDAPPSRQYCVDRLREDLAILSV